MVVDQMATLGLQGIEAGEQVLNVGVFKIIGRLLDFVLMEDITVVDRAGRRIGPLGAVRASAVIDEEK